MPSSYQKFGEFLNNGKNFTGLLLFLIIFLSIVKLPSVLSTDIQPWDEGMYAARVLSIHVNGDFADQSLHSVGNFYSGSHPPLLIWIGYFATLLFGISSVVLKLTALFFALLCVLMIFLTGKKLFSQSTGFFAAMIFSGNMIFNVFSKRFQFDYPYTFFILLSFYLFFLYADSRKFKYLFLSGVSFGCCLMIKILVGIYIPMILLISYFFVKDKISLKIKDVFILTIIGIAIALPWHLYMVIKHGTDFTDYFFRFHIYDRALTGVDLNQKDKNLLYYFNFLFAIIPYSIIVFISLFNDVRKFNSLSWKKIFLWIWFITGFLIISLFRTKLEVYLLLVLPPLCFLIPLFINELDKKPLFYKSIVVFLTFINIFYTGIKFYAFDLKYLFFQTNLFISVLILTAVFIFLYFTSKYLANKIELKKTYYIFILIFFFAFNIYYAIRVNVGETDFRISNISELIEQSRKRKIVYVATNYRYNPQFSFYFKGLDLNWDNPDFEFSLVDTKDGLKETFDYLNSLGKENYFIIVEKDNINRGEYQNSDLFIPYDYKLVLKQEGYELYEN